MTKFGKNPDDELYLNSVKKDYKSKEGFCEVYFFEQFKDCGFHSENILSCLHFNPITSKCTRPDPESEGE